MSQASMTALADFVGSLNARIVTATNERKVEAAITIANGLTQTTPIDTGAAISNWQVTLDAPALTMIDPYFESVLGTHNHHSHGDTSGAAFNAQAAMIAAERATADTKPNQPIFITNNDPAVDATNTGRTPMRPEQQLQPGYVERSLSLSASIIERAKLNP